MSYTIRVEGLRQLARTVREENVVLDGWLREGLLGIGEKVAEDVRSRYSPYSTPGAAGVKAKVTKPGSLLVAQTLRKSRDLSRRRKNFGGLMMRVAFIPALEQNNEKVDEELQGLLREMEAIWE